MCVRSLDPPYMVATQGCGFSNIANASRLSSIRCVGVISLTFNILTATVFPCV